MEKNTLKTTTLKSRWDGGRWGKMEAVLIRHLLQINVVQEDLKSLSPKAVKKTMTLAGSQGGSQPARTMGITDKMAGNC